MSQTSAQYVQAMDNVPVGTPYDISVNSVVSAPAQAAISYGRAVVLAQSVAGGVRQPAIRRVILTFSADLVTSNVVTSTVNGVALAGVTFATSHLATMNAVAAQIAALPAVASATVGGGSNRVITVDFRDIPGAVTQVVTLGGSQATVTPTTNASPPGLFIGVALRKVAQEQNPSAETTYTTTQAVSVLTKGRVWVPVTVAVSPGQRAFAIATAGANNGQFTNVDDSGATTLSTNTGVFLTSTTGAGQAVLEL